MEAVLQQRAGAQLMRILALTLVITLMSATMYNIVLPEIALHFSLSLAEASWVSTAFLLFYAIGSVVYGKLADIYKLRDLITFGLIVFAVGSIVGLFAQAYWMLIAGRALQAIGGSVIPATSFLIPLRYFPPERRGQAIGTAVAGMAVGGALGPMMAGLIVSFLDWRWLFVLPLFTLILLPAYRRYLDDRHSRSGQLDWIGGGLLALAVALLLLAITRGEWQLLALDLVCISIFAIRVFRARSPFVDLRLLRNRRYAAGLLIAFVGTGLNYSMPFLSPQLLASVNGLDAGLIGFALVPASVCSALLGRQAGKLADRKGNAALFYGAVTFLFCCFLLLGSFAGASAIWIAAILVLGSVGQTFMLIALSNAVSQSLPEEHAGVGMGLLSMMNFIAGAIAASAYGTIVDNGSGMRLNPLVSDPKAYVFSNIYIALAVLLAGVVLLFRNQFGKGGRA